MGLSQLFTNFSAWDPFDYKYWENFIALFSMNKKEYIKELSPSSTLSYSAYGELFLALQTCLQDNDDTIFKCLQFEILKKQCGRNAFVLEC